LPLAVGPAISTARADPTASIESSMRQVLSLIAAKSKAELSTADVDQARQALDAVHAESGTPDWLAQSEACDVPLAGDPDKACEAVRTALRDRPIEVNVLPAENRRKKLLIADMDSTMIQQECIDELAATIGLRAEIAAITESAMRGEIAFEPALRKRVALFKGLSISVVDRVIAEQIEITPGAATLVATMRATGAHTALVSGGFSSFVQSVGEEIGFHETRANVLLHDGGQFTGFVAEPILGSDAKEQALLELTKRLGLSLDETLAVGDGANDSAMIKKAGLGVGYRAKPALKAIADAAIDHADLTALLFLQRLPRSAVKRSGACRRRPIQAASPSGALPASAP
jgi:phosphoserine phosphatase